MGSVSGLVRSPGSSWRHQPGTHPAGPRAERCAALGHHHYTACADANGHSHTDPDSHRNCDSHTDSNADGYCNADVQAETGQADRCLSTAAQ